MSDPMGKGPVTIELNHTLAELLARLDVLAGRRLVYVDDVRRQPNGRWQVDLSELVGETPRRAEPIELPASAAARAVTSTSATGTLAHAAF